MRAKLVSQTTLTNDFQFFMIGLRLTQTDTLWFVSFVVENIERIQSTNFLTYTDCLIHLEQVLLKPMASNALRNCLK